MYSNPLRKNLKPHLWFQLYWVVYLIWFFWLDLTVKNPKYIIHALWTTSSRSASGSSSPIAAGSSCWRASRPCSGGTTPPAMTSSA